MSVCRSDSEPTMCLSLTPARRPSITVTKASVEREEQWGAGSLCSRLPSNLSLGGSSSFVPTPAPTTPHSLWPTPSHGPNRSVTPVLFPEHQLRHCGVTRQQSLQCSHYLQILRPFVHPTSICSMKCLFFNRSVNSLNLYPRDPNEIDFQM